MGTILRLQCQQCGFRQEVHAGGGMRDCDTDTILSALPPTEQTVLQQAMEHGVQSLRVERRLSVCKNCKEIYSHPAVRYTQGGQQRELHGVCPRCGKSEPQPVAEGADVPCPCCDSPISPQRVGWWD